MAAELVGGAFLSATLQAAFERLTSHDVTNYFRSRKLEDGLLKKLHITLISINQVLEDAEEMQYRKPNVKQWLDELKHAVYEADDLLDEIATEAEKQKLEAEIQTTGTKVRNLFTAFVNLFDKEIESRLKEVLDNLDYLAKQKDVLGLKEGSTSGSKAMIGGKKRLPTTSFVDESSMYGLDGDKEKVINFLCSDDVCTKQPHVVSIVGMGGMGKTTLAQLVSNDKRMEEQFELRAWVCVSEDFDVVGVTKFILKALHCSTGDTEDLNSLQHQMKDKLTGKKFLLVLDDVWNESHASWEALQVPFSFSSSGSKILVTTRSGKVASIMRSRQIHHLRPLEEEACWKLFTGNAFIDQDVGAYANLESIGRKIVDKCKGLPLAIKTLGSLLQTKLSHQEWVKILESDMWDLPENDNDIIPALRLSYHYLPSYLKRCFAYCSIFPKDFRINKDVLIHLWMAEGLLQSFQTNKCVEELGNEYFNELESRSFFQQAQGQCDYFIMHDLLNDLAKFVLGEFCFRLDSDTMAMHIPKKVRHFSCTFRSYVDLEIFKPLINSHQLRSFIPNFEIRSRYTNFVGHMTINHDFLSRLKYLRVLSLIRCKNLIELGDDISNLKHLRYLDLSYSDIRKLSNSICTLHNLQTLKLNDCEHLTELPSNLHKLINLRHLDIDGSGIRELPINLGRLTNLRTLTSFPVSKNGGCSIKEMGKLKHLQGGVSILELQNVIEPMDAKEAKMKDKKNLNGLYLEWNKDNENSEIERRVLDALQPPRNLQELTVIGYGGTRFPDWLGSCCLFNLVNLELKGSKHCLSLPSLGQLPSLISLDICDFDAIEVIGSEFYGDKSSNLPFKHLKNLMFQNMREWQEWLFLDCDKEDEYFPCLEELHMINCPKLRKAALPRSLPLMRELTIKNCQLLEVSLPKATAMQHLELQEENNISGNGANRSFLDQLVFSNAYVEDLGFAQSLWYLSIVGAHSLMSFSLDLLPNLCQLILSHCEQLELLLQRGLHSSLASVELKHCPKLVTFPKGGISAPKLDHLFLCNLSNLKSLPENMHTLLPSLRSLSLKACEELESLPQEGLPSSLLSLSIYVCPKLIASRMEWGLQNLHSLSYFIISDDFEDVEPFPEEGLLPPNVKILDFDNCSKLKLINYRGLVHLESLESLHIHDCPCLQCLPEEGLPKSLSSCYIYKSPLLEIRCQREKCQDWHKISHIPRIYIGGISMTQLILRNH